MGLIAGAYATPACAEQAVLQEGFGLLIVELTLLPVVTVPGIVAAWGNGSRAADGRRPSKDWRLFGWLTGGVNAGVGLLMFSAGLGLNAPALWAFGLMHLAIGGAALGTTYWGLKQPPLPRIAVAPLFQPSTTTRATPLRPCGLSVAVVGW